MNRIENKTDYNHDNNAGSSCNIEEKRIRINQNTPGRSKIFLREKD